MVLRGGSGVSLNRSSSSATKLQPTREMPGKAEKASVPRFQAFSTVSYTGKHPSSALTARYQSHRLEAVVCHFLPLPFDSKRSRRVRNSEISRSFTSSASSIFSDHSFSRFVQRLPVCNKAPCRSSRAAWLSKRVER